MYFVLGMLTYALILPFIEGLSAYLLAWLEAKKAKWGEEVSLANIRIQQASQEAEESSLPKMNVIGFAAPEACEDYEEETDDDDC